MERALPAAFEALALAKVVSVRVDSACQGPASLLQASPVRESEVRESPLQVAM